MTPEQSLACGIFEQAIEDYRLLKKTGAVKLNDCCCDYSVNDIERFFGSRWCSNLLEMMNSNLSGSDVLRKIQTQCC